MNPPKLGLTRGFVATLILLLLYTAGLVAYACLATKQDVLAMFVENGPVENQSIAGWLSLCAFCLWSFRLAPRVLLPGALTALVGAAREDDLQNAITGENLFRLKWYFKAVAPLSEKLIAASVLIAVIGLLLYMLGIGARAFLRPASWQHGWVLTTILALGVGAASLVLDKLQAYVHDFTGHWLHQQASLIVKALEEGLELALPLLFVCALLQYRQLRRHGS